MLKVLLVGRVQGEQAKAKKKKKVAFKKHRLTCQHFC